MRRWKSLLLAPVLGAAAFNALACYTVYDRADRVVYQSTKPPVDMSRPLHETLPAGHHMIFDTAPECPVISSLANGAGGRNLTSVSPLLTDESTARAMNVPHTRLAGGIALIRPGNATMAPGVTVLPTAATELAAKKNARDTVITEWRNPPMTTVESVERSADPTRAMGAGPAPRR